MRAFLLVGLMLFIGGTAFGGSGGLGGGLGGNNNNNKNKKKLLKPGDTP